MRTVFSTYKFNNIENSNLIPFGGKEIRKVIHHDEWYFSVIDVIKILTDSAIPRNYWSYLKR
jgi:DNA-damage-inducible protein D